MTEARKVQIEFFCDKCGLISVGIGHLPTNQRPNTRVDFAMKCQHCGKQLRHRMTVARARKHEVKE